MPFFVPMLKPDGKEILINLDLCSAIDQDSNGNAVAVSLAGAGIALGTKYETIKEEMFREVGGP